MSARPDPRRPAAGADPAPLLLALVVLAAGLPAVLAWAVATAVLRRNGPVRRWHLALGALTLGGAWAALLGPESAVRGHLWLAATWAPGALSAGDPGGLHALLAALPLGLAHQLPLGIPVGALVATATTGKLQPRPEFDPAEQRHRARVERRALSRSSRAAGRAAIDPGNGALGASLGGDLPAAWRRGRFVALPAGQLDLSMLLIGTPGAGKSTAAERLAYLAGRERRQLIALDGKGDADFTRGVVAAYLAGRPDAAVRRWPAEPYDLWRGAPAEVVGRLMGAWSFTAEAEFYANIAQLALRLAAAAPDAPPISSSVELVARLDPNWLVRAWAGHQTEANLAKGLKDRLADVAVRMGNLAAALGPAFDGAWAVEDADLALFTIPTMANPSDGDAAMRMLLGDLAHYAVRRKPRERPSLVLFDEFSSLEGGRRAALNLVERARGARMGVVLAGQSVAALGNEDERTRLLHAAAAVLAFRQPDPAQVLALAGTERRAETAWQVDGAEVTGRGTVTMRAAGRVDPGHVRAAPTGVGVLVAAGRAERLRVIRTDTRPPASRAPGRRPVLPSPRWGRPALLRRGTP